MGLSQCERDTWHILMEEVFFLLIYLFLLIFSTTITSIVIVSTKL